MMGRESMAADSVDLSAKYDTTFSLATSFGPKTR
jgi:hypothetical protein